ncbi:MAG: hypothetical protein IT536_11700 [Hyphomicrobiales bacterium]|nr:hypothetical protein [Hyphomicrobiales bacterium]
MGTGCDRKSVAEYFGITFISPAVRDDDGVPIHIMVGIKIVCPTGIRIALSFALQQQLPKIGLVLLSEKLRFTFGITLKCTGNNPAGANAEIVWATRGRVDAQLNDIAISRTFQNPPYSRNSNLNILVETTPMPLAIRASGYNDIKDDGRVDPCRQIREAIED